MCSEIDRFSSFLRRNMSGTRNTLFPHVKEQDKAKALDEEVEEVASGMEGKRNSEDDQKEVEKVTNEGEGDTDRQDRARARVSVSSEKQLADDDDNGDGFRTPTSSDHKIPVIVECPPAPRKPRPEPSRLKRKASPPLILPRELDSTTEIESIFRPISSQDSAEEKKPKKARREQG